MCVIIMNGILNTWCKYGINMVKLYRTLSKNQSNKYNYDSGPTP